MVSFLGFANSSKIISPVDTCTAAGNDPINVEQV